MVEKKNRAVSNKHKMYMRKAIQPQMLHLFITSTIFCHFSIEKHIFSASEGKRESVK